MASTQNGFQILPAGGALTPVLARLHAACFERPWGQVELAQLLAMPGAEAVIVCMAAESRMPAGFAVSRVAGDEGEILTLCVDPARRRAGAARALVHSVTDRMACGGVARLFLEVATTNTAARALYAGLGFACVGRRPGYYRDAGGAPGGALIMRMDIVPSAPGRYDAKARATASLKKET